VSSAVELGAQQEGETCRGWQGRGQARHGKVGARGEGERKASAPSTHSANGEKRKRGSPGDVAKRTGAASFNVETDGKEGC